MNIIYVNRFELHDSLVDNDKRYMKVTMKTKIIEGIRSLISADYRKF